MAAGSEDGKDTGRSAPGRQSLGELAAARCVAAYDRDGRLAGYWTRGWQYGTLADRRWVRWPRTGSLRRGVQDRARAISDWDLGNERLLRSGYRLVPVPEAEALAKLGGNG